MQSGGTGFEFTGAGAPNITLNSDATSAGRMLLENTLFVADGYTGAGLPSQWRRTRQQRLHRHGRRHPHLRHRRLRCRHGGTRHQRSGHQWWPDQGGYRRAATLPHQQHLHRQHHHQRRHPELSNAGTNNNISGSPIIEIADGATLDVTGLAGSRFDLANGQTLQGTSLTSGGVTGSVTAESGSEIAPGFGVASIGTLDISANLTLDSGSTVTLELASALGTVANGHLNTPDENRQAIIDNHLGEDPTIQHDSIEMDTLDLTLGGTINVTGLVGWTPGQGQYFDLFDGTIISDASTFNTYGVSNGISGGLRFRSGSQSANFQLKLPNIAAVSPALRWDTSLFLSHGIIFINPEPSRALLLLMGFAATILRRRRRRGRRS